MHPSNVDHRGVVICPQCLAPTTTTPDEYRGTAVRVIREHQR
jgi:hypothetical protein